MKNQVKSLTAFVVLFSVSAFADAVLWYRFDGDSDTVVNFANPSVMNGTLKSINSWGSLGGLGNAAHKFPERVSAFPDGTRLVVPASETVHPEAVTALRWSGKSDDAGTVFLSKADAAPLLSLKTFTCEVFFRLPAEIIDRSSERLFPFVNWGSDGAQGWKFAIWNRVEGDFKTGERITPWVRAMLSDGNGGSKAKSSTWYPADVNITTNTWHHLAFIVDGKGDGSDATVKFILDYNEVYSVKVSEYYGFYFKDDSNSPFPFTVGANLYRTSKNCCFQGDIAEFRISDKALTVDELLRPIPAGPVDEDTLFYLPLGDGSWFAHKGNDNDNFNKMWILSSAISEWQPRWDYLDADTENRPPLPTVVPDAPVDACRAGVLAETGFADDASLKFVRKEVNGKLIAYQHSIFVPDETNALQQDDFSLEFYFKQPTPMNKDTNGTATLVYANWGKICINEATGGLLVRPYLEVGGVTEVNRYANVDMSFEVDTGKSSYGVRVDDNKWHHFAFVWEQATSNLVAYLDYRRISSKVIPTGLQHTGFKYKGFYIGCENMRTKQGFGGYLDDVRLTRRALRPHEFLTSRRKVGATNVLFHARFENDYSSGIGEDIVGDGVPRPINNGDKGNMPQFCSAGGNSKAFDDNGMTNALANANALRLQGGEVYWPHNSLLERQNITVEFFAALKGCAHGANLIRFSPGYDPFSPNPYGNPSTPLWGIYTYLQEGRPITWKVVTLSCTNDAQRLLLQVPTAENKDRGRHDVSAPAKPEMDDGRWHHWALTIETVDSDTKWTLYCDYEMIATATNPGLLYSPIYGSVFEIGGTASNTAHINGRIDEVRITDGILTPDKFMRRGTLGFMFICR